MRKLPEINLYPALLHYPVVNKNGQIIASAVTNLDLHDIARAAKTYGVKKYYIITPLADQKELVGKIVAHWTHGVGAGFNPLRREALELITVRSSLKEVIDEIGQRESKKIRLVVTSAKKNQDSLSCSDFRDMLNIKKDNQYILLFGTAWGLAKEVIEKADYVLEPISGNTPYNHLSVRSAAAIIMDRLLGNH